LGLLSLFQRKKKVVARRGFSGAEYSRLVSKWRGNIDDIDNLIYGSLATLRGRSRELSLNNDYMVRFLNLLRSNVVGQNGISLQCLFKDKQKIQKDINDKIEEEFKIWSKKGVCDVTKKFSFQAIQKQVISSFARDGEALVRFVRGNNFNEFGLALQVLDVCLLDDRFNFQPTDKNQNIIKMGIELDAWGAPVAYYLKTKGYGDNVYTYFGNNYTRVPANEILHIYDPVTPDQTRGFPLIHAAMKRLKMLGAYEEAEIVAAQVASSKMGFFTQDEEGAYEGDDEEQEKDDDGNLIQEASPGAFELLPKGVKFQDWNPEHPAGNFSGFIKACLRGISSGMNVSYNSLASDLEGVNYSSLRAGLLEERDYYKLLQGFLIENFMQPVYEKWLETSFLMGIIPIKAGDIRKYQNPKWLGRRWAWVDPLKETKANKEAVEAGFKSRRGVCIEEGRNIEDVFGEIKQEQELADKLGIKIGTNEKEGDDGAENES